jgi:thiamine transport system permease protein
LPKFKVTIIDRFSSHKTIAYSIYIGAILFFLTLILIPPIFGIGLKWNLIGEITEDPELMARATNAIWASFAVAILVSTIDLVVGIPTAWFITRGKSRWLNVVDTLADIPFVVPTVTLGYSLLLFWSSSQGISSLFGSSLVSPGWLLVILLHFVFSFPVVVRVMVGALLDYQRTFEEAARTLGAPPFTVSRTVTFPILKPSLIGAFMLAFARSVSETGATIMVVEIFENGKRILTFENGAIFVREMKLLGLDGALAFVSFVLILISCAIFGAILIFGSKLHVPLRRVWPSFERRLSSTGIAATRDTFTLLVFFLLVILPSLFVALPTFSAIADGTINNAVSGSGIWQKYWSSLGLSYFVGGLATLLSILAGLPMAVLIARKRLGRSVSAVLDTLINIPIIVPSTALGVSLGFFWTNFVFMPEIMLLILAHLSITYSYFVRSMAAAIERTDIELENAARIHGAKPFTVFRTIILPLTKYSLLAGAIMVLTRSVSETGATLAVVSQIQTVPVLLVEWLNQYQTGPTTITPSDIGLGCGILIILSFIVLLFLKLGVGRKAVY